MSDITHEALPSGTIISIGEAPNVQEAEHYEKGWQEVNPHCVDCGGEWHPDGTPANYNAGDDMLDLGSATVTHVPAEWLTVRLTLLLANATTDVPEEMLDAIKGLGIDAGLS